MLIVYKCFAVSCLIFFPFEETVFNLKLLRAESTNVKILKELLLYLKFSLTK